MRRSSWIGTEYSFVSYRYDVNTTETIKRIINRLASQISQYKEKIAENAEASKNKDIPFGSLYRQLLAVNERV
jgi:gas vesicle protein